MEQDPFAEAVDAICDKDDRYDPEAYYFLKDGLEFTSKMLNKPADGANRHVSGKELLDGLRAFALQEYGPMTLSVLRSWGITKTEDFGELVFSLVETGRLGKTETDNKADFAGGFDFDEAFAKPFRPVSPLPSKGNARQRKHGVGSPRPGRNEAKP